MKYWDKFKFIIYHSEKVTSTVVKLIVQYQHKLAYCIYSNNIIIKPSSDNNVKGYTISSGCHNKWICCSCIIYFFAHDIVANIESEAMISSTIRNSFHQWMIAFSNILEFNYKQYQRNGTIRDDNYERSSYPRWETLCNL